MKVVLLSRPTIAGFQQRTLEAILASGHEVCGCLVDARTPPTGSSRLAANLRRGRGGYVVVMALRALRRRLRGASELELRLPAFLAERGVPTHHTIDAYSASALAWVAERRPDVLVRLGGFGIIRRPLLDAAPRGILSFHFGDMRRYRGQPPAVWELYNGEREAGVTVQRLNDILDGGVPVSERTLEVRRTETVRSLTERMYAVAPEMMVEALDRLAAPDFHAEPIDAPGTLYTLPNLRQWLVLHSRIARRRLFGVGPAR